MHIPLGGLGAILGSYSLLDVLLSWVGALALLILSLQLLLSGVLLVDLAKSSIKIFNYFCRYKRW